MNMKTIFKTTIICLLLFPCYILAAPTHLDKIVAIVNDDVITQSELDKRIAMFKLQLTKSGVATPPISMLQKQALDGLINIVLQLQIAKNNKIQVSDRELDSIIANIAKGNKLTVDQLKQSLLEHEKLSFAEYRNQIREQILLHKVQQHFLGRDIVVTNKETAEVLRHPPQADHPPIQYHVVDVLFEVPEDVTSERLEMISKVAKQMAIKLQRVGVEEVVQESQNILKEQTVQSSDLGWRKVDELPTLFAKDIVNMKTDQAIGPLQAPNGLHLIKLLGINSPDLASAKLTKDQAVEMVYHRKLMEKVNPWLKERRTEAYIKIIK